MCVCECEKSLSRRNRNCSRRLAVIKQRRNFRAASPGRFTKDSLIGLYGVESSRLFWSGEEREREFMRCATGEILGVLFFEFIYQSGWPIIIPGISGLAAYEDVGECV